VHLIYSRNQSSSSNHPFYNIYEQYFNEAAFLWVLRSVSLNQPHINKKDIITLEKRIQSQLEGLLTSIDISWSICEESVGLNQAGEIFTSLYVAMNSNNLNNVKKIVESGLESESGIKELTSAIEWLPVSVSNSWLKLLLRGKDLHHKHLGSEVCSFRRIDPGEALLSILKREDCKQNYKFYSSALKLAGELKRQDCISLIHNALKNKDYEVYFWANWSCILLGSSKNAENLKSYVFNTGKLQNQAIDICFRVLPINMAKEWISELSKNNNKIRAAIRAIGILGDPHAVTWLINKMTDSLNAKLAGESFSLITGLDLTQNNLASKEPDNYPVIPGNDEEDHDVRLDSDENLPYPNVKNIESSWKKIYKNFVVGKRYFMGSLITSEHLKEYVENGMQRQRHYASLELALCETDKSFINTYRKN